MNAYKFDITVGNDGSLHLPFLSELSNQDVEVIIVPGSEKIINSQQSKAGMDFVDRWSGFITENQDTVSRIDYLSEKYK